MVTARPINLIVSCKLHPYSLQTTQSPPGPCLPKRTGNTHPRNYYDKKYILYSQIIELKKLWNRKGTVIPIMISTLTTVPRGLVKGPEELEMGGRAESIQTPVLLRSAKILG